MSQEMNENHSMKYVDDIKIDTVRGLHVIKIHDLFNKKTQFSLLCNYLSVGLFHSFQYKRPKRIKSDMYFRNCPKKVMLCLHITTHYLLDKSMYCIWYCIFKKATF